jgi:cell division protein FtsZ
VVDEQVSMIDAFAMINEGVLSQSVRGLSDIITRPGHINVDYADIRTIMKDRGLAVMGTGKASGKGRARQAALEAISSPLLENMSVVGAHGVLCNITGGKGLGLHEISEAASVVYEQAHEDANIIIGSVIDESLVDEVIVTIIATDFERPAVVEEEIVIEPLVQVHQEEVMVAAAPVQEPKPEPIAEALPLIREIESMEMMAKDEEEELMFEFEESSVAEATADKEAAHQKEDSFLDKSSTFNCAVDSKDLDIPTFMRK